MSSALKIAVKSELSSSILRSCTKVSFRSSSSKTDVINSPPVTSDIPRKHEQQKDKTTSFALSGCGWLTPFYFGVIEKMIDAGYITDKSLIAGTSGGSLGALVAVSGISPRVGLEFVIAMSLDKNFKGNIDVGLKTLLPQILPDNIVERCNGRLHVCVTKLWPNPVGSPHIISEFQSQKDLIDTIAASCFIPLYSTPRTMFTRITYRPLEYFIDGGVFGFMPPIGDVRVSPLSVIPLRRPANIQIRPSVFSTPKLLSWVLTPAPPAVLEELYQEGYRAAEEWIALEEEKGTVSR